jgi:sulfite reductase (NADPH) flavoprotein alpha-component
MTIQDTRQDARAGSVPVIPEGAPFSREQRAWLNGFFAGLLSLDAQAGISPMTGELPGAAQMALAGGEEDDAPWHDAAMPIAERMQLAEGKPLKRRLFAAMAQQDCGQCGYLCETYSAAVAAGTETKLNLCVPGGKETSRMLKRLLEEAPVSPSPVVAVSEAKDTLTPKEAAEPGYSRDQPVTAIFRSATPICGAGSEKDTRHVVIDISGSGISYAPGDSFGLLPTNDPALADAVLAAMRAPADLPIGDKTFRQALIEDYALGPAPDMLFELIGYLTGGAKRKKAKLLAKGEDPDGDAATFDVLAALETLGPVHPDPEAFLECLEPLQPRLYSISSSPIKTPGEIHLTVDAVRYDIAGRKRLGVASTFLADRTAAGARLNVYLQKAHGFGLPADPAVPIIMVGPGTGIAPFRSFLWQRNAMQAAGKSWLFFGHQREAAHFFYREELEHLSAAGTLSRLSTAWSRDAPQKVYVQDRMREEGAELWSWLEEGAHFYVCGDAKRMAKDVEAALVSIAVAHGRKSESTAKDFLAGLKAGGRYQADVY